MAFELPALSPQLLLGLTALVLFGYDSVYPSSQNREALVGITAVGLLASLATRKNAVDRATTSTATTNDPIPNYTT
jgi:hypothetical protein